MNANETLLLTGISLFPEFVNRRPLALHFMMSVGLSMAASSLSETIGSNPDERYILNDRFSEDRCHHKKTANLRASAEKNDALRDFAPLR